MEDWNDDLLEWKEIIETILTSGSTKITLTNKSQLFENIKKLIEHARKIKYVTHAVKYHHPDAQGSGFYLEESSDHKDEWYVSTFSIKKGERQVDFVGNANVMKTMKFIDSSYKGEKIISRIIRKDLQLFNELPIKSSEKEQLNKDLEELTKKIKPTSNQLSKQVYFPVGDSYHILSPLFPSTLAFNIYENIMKSKNNKENPSKEISFWEFPNTAVQKFGGSQPQNISFLNYKRKGKHFLLASFPPNWDSSRFRLPIKTNSIFNKSYFPFQVKYLIKSLKNFLLKTKHNNAAIRIARENFIIQICDALMKYAEKIMSQEDAGWSKDPECILNSSQIFWLDPGRGEMDEDWGKQREKTDWINDVSGQFARWLNKELRTDKSEFGDDEYKEWKRQIKKKLKGSF